VVAARTAKEAGCQVILDMGGRDEALSSVLLQNVDIISPNETELERVIGKKTAAHDKESLKAEIANLLKTHPKLKVLLKMGSSGAAFYELNEAGTMTEVFKPSVSFEDHKDLHLVDTTGAGDCFTGAFAVKLSQGGSPEEALTFAN